MTNSWDLKFANATALGEPAKVLNDHSHLLPSSGTALDVACGLGANALFLSQLGFNVSAWDSSTVALQKLADFALTQKLSIKTQNRDLESHLDCDDRFDVITVSNFLYRPLCKLLVKLLNPNGLLFYQTFTLQKSTGDGPTNPAFLLEKNELLTLFAELSPVCYREERDCGDINRGLRNIAYLVARKD